jgi:hypothetical protein
VSPVPWQNFRWGVLDDPGPQTESSIERGFRLPGPVDDEWGRSESLDPDNVGDIADEGTGHRGWWPTGAAYRELGFKLMRWCRHTFVQ